MVVHMIRFIVMLTFVGTLAILPVYYFSNTIMPSLLDLKQTYQSVADQADAYNVDSATAASKAFVDNH